MGNHQVTFFVAFVALDAKREKRAKNGAPWNGYQCGCGSTEYDEEQYSKATLSKEVDVERVCEQSLVRSAFNQIDSFRN